jgi:hypothetical protein
LIFELLGFCEGSLVLGLDFVGEFQRRVLLLSFPLDLLKTFLEQSFELLFLLGEDRERVVGVSVGGVLPCLELVGLLAFRGQRVFQLLQVLCIVVDDDSVFLGF